jgi:hypothetical protein
MIVIENENWSLNGDCVNITGDLSDRDIIEIANIKVIRVIQPWKYLAQESVWLDLNERIFKDRPEVVFHIWADTFKSDFNFLAKMSNVRILYLNQVKFKNKETLGTLKHLKSLTIINGNVNELNFLSKFKELEKLELGRIKNLRDVSFISDLPKIITLNLNNQAQITSLPNFGNNKELRIVELFQLKNLIDVSSLCEIKKLKSLAFHGLSAFIEPDDFIFLKESKDLKEVFYYFNLKEKNSKFLKFKNEVLKI